MFKKVKKIEFFGRICEVVAAKCLNISNHIKYINPQSVKKLSLRKRTQKKNSEIFSFGVKILMKETPEENSLYVIGAF